MLLHHFTSKIVHRQAQVPSLPYLVRDELSRWLKEMLLDSNARSRPYLRANSLEEILKRAYKWASELHV